MGATVVAVAGVRHRRRCKKPEVSRVLTTLARDEVPLCLRPEFYFDFETHPFRHAELLTSAHDIVEVLGSIHKYAEQWLRRHSSACGRQSPSAKLSPATKTVG